MKIYSTKQRTLRKNKLHFVPTYMFELLQILFRAVNVFDILEHVLYSLTAVIEFCKSYVSTWNLNVFSTLNCSGAHWNNTL